MRKEECGMERDREIHDGARKWRKGLGFYMAVVPKSV
jgi:hypothetical protein